MSSPFNGSARTNEQHKTPASGLFPKRKAPAPVMKAVPGMAATRANLLSDRKASLPKKGRA